MKELTLTELLEAGSHFGHQIRRWNPGMKTYIYGDRDGVHIFDLAKTKKGLDEACEYVKSVAASGGVILFVGSKRQASTIVKAAAARVGMPYMVERWVGGLLTNFSELSKRVRTMKDLKEKRERGELKKYTKREQLLIDREIAKLEKFFAGVAGMEKLPQAMFIVDSHREDVAVREGVRMRIPVVAMVDTNGDPNLVDYVVPINDDAVKSIELTVNRIANAIAEGKGLPIVEIEVKQEEKPVVEEAGAKEEAEVIAEPVETETETKPKKKTAAKKVSKKSEEKKVAV